MTEQTINDTGMSYIPVHSIVRLLLNRHVSAKFVPQIWWWSTWLSLRWWLLNTFNYQCKMHIY